MEDDLKDDLRKRINRCQKVINTLENNEGWQMVIEDYQKGEKLIDDSWINEFDENKLNQFRITKLASREISQLLGKYKDDLLMAKQQLYKLEHPDEVITKDYDTE